MHGLSLGPVFRCAFLLLVLAGCAQSNESAVGNSGLANTKQDDGVVGGLLVPLTDNSPMHKSAVLIEMIVAGKNGNMYCSGSLIGRHTVLTAAHCLDATYLKNLKSFNIIFEDSRYAKNPKVRAGKNFVLHPQYKTDSVVTTYRFSDGELLPMTIDRRYDAAVAFFDGSIPSGYYPAIIDTNQDRVYEDQFVSIYGYGFAAHYNPNFHASAPTQQKVIGYLRSGRLQISKREFELSDMYMTSDLSAAQPCTFDSGSPQYMTENGQAVVVGITSARLSRLSRPGHALDFCGDANLAEKVAPISGWVLFQMSSHNSGN